MTLSSLNKSQVELIDAHLLRRRLITLTNKTYQKLASADRSEGAGVYIKTKIWILCCGLHPLTSFLKGFIDILKDFVTFLKDFTDFLKDSTDFLKDFVDFLMESKDSLRMSQISLRIS